MAITGYFRRATEVIDYARHWALCHTAAFALRIAALAFDDDQRDDDQ